MCVEILVKNRTRAASVCVLKSRLRCYVGLVMESCIHLHCGYQQCWHVEYKETCSSVCRVQVDIARLSHSRSYLCTFVTFLVLYAISRLLSAYQLTSSA